MRKIFFLIVLFLGSLLFSEMSATTPNNIGNLALNDAQFTIKVPVELDKLPDGAMLDGRKISYLIECSLHTSGEDTKVASSSHTFDGNSNVDKIIIFNFKDIPLNKLHKISMYKCNTWFETSRAATSIHNSNIIGLPDYSKDSSHISAQIE